MQARGPALSAVFPQGARPGETVEAAVLGQYLDRAARVVFTEPGVTGEVLSGSHGALRLRLRVDSGVPPGPRFFRVISPRGASNVLLFRIGGLPHVAETEPNSTLDRAQPVPVPATIQGQLPVDGDFDFFRFQASRGETLVFDLRAARNGNGLDAALILLDARGRKLNHSEDVFVWDPFFAHTFAETGEYIAVIQPTHTRNDPGFAYQLDIRRSPHVASLQPLALRPGSQVEATLFGAGFTASGLPLRFSQRGIEGTLTSARGTSALARIAVAADAAPGEVEFSVVTPEGLSNPGRLVIDPAPVAREDQLTAPATVLGTAVYRRPERFRFQAEAGETLVFEGRSQRFGTRADLTLRVIDSKGREVAANDDGNFFGVVFNKDPELVHTFTEPGGYTLEVRNLWKVTGEDFPYQLSFRRAHPRFDLALGNDSLRIEPNGTLKVKVTATRREGHRAPIPIRVTGLPAGITVDEAAIAEGAGEAELTLRCGALAPGLTAAIDVSGGGIPARRQLRIAGGGGEGAANAVLTGAQLTVVEPTSFSLEAALNSVNLVRGGQTELKVNIERAKDFTSPLRFRFEGLPAGVSADDVVAGPDEAVAILRLRATADVSPGRAARVLVIGRTETGEVQEAPRIGLIVD